MSYLIKSITVISILALLIFVNSVSAQDDIQGTIEIPALELSAPIYQVAIANGTWDVSGLNMSVGRLQGLPWFGSNTNVALDGHSTNLEGNPDIFYNLGALVAGDVINVHTNGQVYSYIVASQEVVNSNDLEIVFPTGGSRLTLFTCDPSSFNSGTELSDRRIVIYAYPA